MDYRIGDYSLHTHSFYCGHAVGTISDYVEKAKENDIKLLGFTEHCPVKDNRWIKSRMDYSQMPYYLEDIDKEIEKNSESITLLKGFECDYLKEYHSYYQELKEQVDFLIAGVHSLQLPSHKDFPLHNYPLGKKELSVYCDECISSIESGLFTIFAHPDVFAIQYFKWDEQAKAISKEILDCATYYDIPLEINGNGLIRGKILVDGKWRDPYPLREFWLLAQDYPTLKIVGNPDAHDPEHLSLFKKNCKDFISPFNLKYSICHLDENKKLSFRN